MNRALSVILLAALLVQIGLLCSMLRPEKQDDGKVKQLDQLLNYTIAMSQAGVAVANFNLAMSDSEQSNAELRYNQAHDKSVAELNDLSQTFSGNPKASEAISKSQRLNEIADKTVRTMKDAVHTKGADRRSTLLLMMTAMLKLNRITNGLLEQIETLRAEISPAKAEQKKDLLALALNGLSILLLGGAFLLTLRTRATS